MITINHCKKCHSDFMIPEELTVGLDNTMFVCPHCHSREWMKLSEMDKSIMRKE